MKIGAKMGNKKTSDYLQSFLDYCNFLKGRLLRVKPLQHGHLSGVSKYFLHFTQYHCSFSGEIGSSTIFFILWLPSLGHTQISFLIFGSGNLAPHFSHTQYDINLHLNQYEIEMFSTYNKIYAFGGFL